MKIKQINFDAVTPFKAQASKERVSFENPLGAHWYGIYDSGKLVSFYCLVLIGRTARFKSNYTVPEFRGRGCLQEFIVHAKNICKAKHVPEMTAFCTPLSVKSHIRNGATVMSQRNDIAFVRYML